MNQEMTFGQALDWMNEDNSRVVCAVGSDSSCSRLQKGVLQYNTFGVSEDGWANDNEHLAWKLNTKWRPYVAPKPKSVIEQHIEGCLINMIVDINTRNEIHVKRLVNLALDEAKKALTANGEFLSVRADNACARIDALKVTL